jgi:hypothetical protein
MHRSIVTFVCMVSAVASLKANDLASLDVTPFPGWNGPQAVWSGSLQEAFMAVHSQTEWNALWQTLFPTHVEPHGEAPYVDFSRFTMLVAALGARPGGGYSVVIQHARDDGATVRISVLEVRPGKGCAETALVTYPISIVLIPRTDRPVHFERDVEDFNCNEVRPFHEFELSSN